MVCALHHHEHEWRQTVYSQSSEQVGLRLQGAGHPDRDEARALTWSGVLNFDFCFLLIQQPADMTDSNDWLNREMIECDGKRCRRVFNDELVF